MGRVIGVFGKDIDSEYLGMAFLKFTHWNTTKILTINFLASLLLCPRNECYLIIINWLSQFLCGCVCFTFIGNGTQLREHVVCLTLSNVLGSVIIITVIEHYFCKLYIHISISLRILTNLLTNDTSFHKVIVGIVIVCGYQYFAAYYRASAREVKRLGLSCCWSWSSQSSFHPSDSMLRSLLYSHLSESLTGMLDLFPLPTSLIPAWLVGC